MEQDVIPNQIEETNIEQRVGMGLNCTSDMWKSFSEPIQNMVFVVDGMLIPFWDS